MNNFFDRVYVITCPHLTDRHEYIRSHLSDKHIDYQFIVAQDSDLFGGYGTTSTEQSLTNAHKNCIQDAMINQYNNCLILEDDVNFIDTLEDEFEKFVSVLPPVWNFLQLGNQFWATKWLDREKLGDNLYQFNWGTGSHCIGVNKNVFEACLEGFERSLQNPVDIIYYEMFAKNKCYCPEWFLADALSKCNHLDHESDKHIFESEIEHTSDEGWNL